MSSRLASLLVQEGRVSAERMAEAFQRQVIYGGALDTVLLELGLADEPQLLDSLPRASELPLGPVGKLLSPMTPDEPGWFSPGLAQQFRAVPLGGDGERARVLVADPPDWTQLLELGELIGRRIDAAVVPEFELAWAMECIYGSPMPARLASLRARFHPLNEGAVEACDWEPTAPVLVVVHAVETVSTPLPEVDLATLRAQLLDSDPAVRHAGAAGLIVLPPSSSLRHLVEELRSELVGEEPLRRGYAAAALGELRDPVAVPKLIELLKDLEPTIVDAAHRSLVEITKQDFDLSRWRWRSWWDRNRSRPRTDWLIAGLLHKSPAVCESASAELALIADSRFCYHAELPAREREEARQKWTAWYKARP